MDSGEGELIVGKPSGAFLQVPGAEESRSTSSSTENLIESISGSTEGLVVSRESNESRSLNEGSPSSQAECRKDCTETLELHTFNRQGKVDSKQYVEYGVRKSPKRFYERNSTACRVLEVVFLSLIVLVLLGLYMIPTGYFINPPLNFPPLTNVLTDSDAVTYTGCYIQFPYTGRICQRELSYIQDPAMSSTFVNVSATSHEVLENFLVIVLETGIPTFNPSPECEEALRLFACLNYLAPCDSNSDVFTFRAMCIDVRDSLCVREWVDLAEFLGPGSLPICEELPEGNPVVLNSTSSVPCANQSCEAVANTPNITQLNCSDLFYFDSVLGICRPSCEWEAHASSETTFTFVLTAISIVMLVLFSTYNILATLTIQRQQLQFPAFYFFIVNTSSFVVGILFVISFSSGTSLRCPQSDYISNILNSSRLVYCEVEGSIVSYFIQVFIYSLFFFALTLFWATAFPFHYRQVKNDGRLKYYITTTLVIIFTFPLVVLVMLIDGYFATNFLTGLCTARNSTHFYVTVTLHLSLLMWLCTSLFTIIMWIIFKNFLMKNIGKGNKKFGSAEKAEIKLLCVLVYVIILTILLLALDSFSASVTPRLYLNALFPYFACESFGRDDSGECQSLLAEVQHQDLFAVSIASSVMISLLPLVVFAFNSDFKAYLMLIKKIRKKVSRASGTSLK